jgi:hypothetical protein
MTAAAFWPPLVSGERGGGFSIHVLQVPNHSPKESPAPPAAEEVKSVVYFQRSFHHHDRKVKRILRKSCLQLRTLSISHTTERIPQLLKHFGGEKVIREGNRNSVT